MFPRHRTAILRSQAFAQQAMGIGGIWFFLDFAWSKYPWIFFLMFCIGSSADAAYTRFRETSQCLWGPFLEKLQEMFPTRRKMLSSDLRAFLVSIMLLWKLSISHIECRHAALRRLILMKSMKNARDFARMAADWLLMRTRSLESESLDWSCPWEQDPVAVADKASKEKSYTCRGGACRAFLSDWWRNKRGTLAEAHEEYAAIKLENGERYRHWKILGAAATQQAHAGNPNAFGESKYEAERSKKRREQKARFYSPLSSAFPPYSIWQMGGSFNHIHEAILHFGIFGNLFPVYSLFITSASFSQSYIHQPPFSHFFSPSLYTLQHVHAVS